MKLNKKMLDSIREAVDEEIEEAGSSEGAKKGWLKRRGRSEEPYGNPKIGMTISPRIKTPSIKYRQFPSDVGKDKKKRLKYMKRDIENVFDFPNKKWHKG